jgi:hypothetical protein
VVTRRLPPLSKNAHDAERRVAIYYLPPFLPGESLIQKGKNFRHVELDIFEVQLFLSIFLHFQKIVELEIELQKATITPCDGCQ